VPLNVVVAPDTKLEPLIVKMNAPGPMTLPHGDSELITGTGLGWLATVRLTPLLVPPPGDGLTTVMVWVVTVLHHPTRGRR
jgi:hypothetical protein